MRSPDPRTRARLWLLVVGLLVALFGWQAYRGIELDTNILDLLPATEQDAVVETSLQTYTDHLARRQVFLLGHSSFDLARRAALYLGERLDAAPAWEQVDVRFGDEQLAALHNLYFPYRHQLLTDQDRAVLTETGGADRFLRQRLQTIYSPTGTGLTRWLDRDPLLLFPATLQGLPRPSGNLALRDDVLTVEEDGRHYVMVAAVSRGNPFARRAQVELMTALSPILADVDARFPDVERLDTGVLRFADHAGSTAQREASTIGIGSLLGIVLLMLITFRSLRHIFASLLPIGVGVVVAFSLSYWFFGGLHLVTLAFGASMIGVCIDYTFHCYTEQLLGGPEWEPELGLQHIFPGITMGAITSGIAYLGLLIAPFPGLRQMAIFSTLGLLAAYLTVVCWFPRLLTRPRPASTRPLLLGAAESQLRLWDRFRGTTTSWLLLVGAVIFSIYGIAHLEADDDVRNLRPSEPDLVAQEQMIRRLVRGPDGNRFFVVEGDTAAELLQHDARLTQQLQQLQDEGIIHHYLGLSQYVPPPGQQRADHELLRQKLTGGEAPLSGYLDSLGLRAEDAAAVTAAISAPEIEVLTVEDWAASDLNRSLPPLWLGETSRGVAAICMVSGVRDEAAMIRLEEQLGSVNYVNKIDDVSDLFRRYRYIASFLVGGAYLLIFVLLVWRYGWRRGTLAVLPPLLAAALTLAILGVVGEPINLFNLMALLLVLGIGIDYSIFLAEVQERREPTMLAILLSATTTVLSFGLLSLSITPILRSFGLTVLIGIVLALLLAPIVKPPNQAST